MVGMAESFDTYAWDDVDDSLQSKQRSHSSPVSVRRYSSKAAGMLVLSLFALLTAPMLGGVVPAITALAMDDATSRQIDASQGFLLGVPLVRAARVCSYVAITLSGLCLVALSIFALAHYGAGAHDQSDSNMY